MLLKKRYYKRKETVSLREHLGSPRFYGIRVAHLFTFLCCPIMCLYFLTSVLLCPLCFPHKNDVRVVFTSSCLSEGSCLICVIFICLHIVVSNTYCVACFYFACRHILSCVPSVANVSGLSILDCSSGFL
jgi:hypothetical protein